MSALTLMTGILLLLAGLLSCCCTPTLGGTEALEQGGLPQQQQQEQQEQQLQDGQRSAGLETGAGAGAGVDAGVGVETGESICPSCALAQVQAESTSQQQADMVEAVKRHILNMLHLSSRPNITKPVPRAALLNAIRKLHVGRVGEDGSVEIDEEDGRLGPKQGELADEQPAEIITFAEPGEFGTL